MGALTSTVIVSQALERLGNATLTTTAGIWLLNLLDRLYEDYSWPFLEKIATGSLAAEATSTNLPADFDSPISHDSFVLTDVNGINHSLRFNTGYDQDLLNDPGLIGEPKHVIIDLNAMTWRTFPLANQQYTYQIRYKFKPARSDVAFTPDFPNDEIMIQGVYVRGLQHEDDDRYVPENQELLRMISVYKAKFNKQPMRSQRVQLSSKFGTPIVFR
ncbi:MAG: hypothetical protein WC773_04675 [Patescibacteria group bacterium]|jgi:hypothetical protein